MPSSRVPAPKTSTLGRKVGPLPLWGWMVVAVGGVAIGLYLRHRLGGAGSVAVSPTTPADASGTPAGAVGASQQPAPSGLSPDLESLLMAQQQGQTALVSAFETTVGGLTQIASGAQAESTIINQQSLGFAASAFGSALDFARAAQPVSQPALVTVAPTVLPLIPAPASSPPPPTPASPTGFAPVVSNPAGSGSFHGGSVQTASYAGQPAPPPINVNVRPGSSYIPAAVTHGRGLGGPQ